MSLDQHSTEQSGGTFMQRTIFHLPGLTAARDALERDFADQVASQFDMDFRLTEASKPKRVAIMASREDHCLLDLLWRNRRGEIDMSVVMVISNHPDLADQVRAFSVPFLHVPATKDIRDEAEQRQLDVLRGNVDLVVLARYMQILTPRFLAEVGCPMINIHHSFLPSFIGAAPYRRAKERGVKLVGATAHYVTEDLDEGPIIEQDVVRVDHRHGVEDLIRLGADVERARSVTGGAVALRGSHHPIRQPDSRLLKGVVVKTFSGLDEFVAAQGSQLGPTEWLEVTQDRVNLFADATDDHQWIHVDPERAANGPFGGAIAHGLLTLSLLPHFMHSMPRMRSTSGRKPRSSISSASSSTSPPIFASTRWPCWARSSRRPGVPTTRSTPRCSAAIWLS